MGVILGLILLFSIAVGAWELFHAICDPLRDHIHSRRKLHNQPKRVNNFSPNAARLSKNVTMKSCNLTSASAIANWPPNGASVN